MRFGNNSESLARRRILQDGQVEISERAFNCIFGGMLLWGLLLNYGIVALFGKRFAYIAANGSTSLFLIAYFISAFVGSALIATPKPSLSFLGYNLIVVPIGFELCLVTEGFAGSPGIAFLFRVMWFVSQRICSSFPVMFMGRRSASIR